MYYILYNKPDGTPTFETVFGEDAMQRRVYNLSVALKLSINEIIVFNSEDQLK